jgi:cell division protein FtsB
MTTNYLFHASADDFKKIPGSPIAYWVSDKVRESFETSPAMGDIADARQGLATADNNRFLRLWQEVSINRIGFGLANRDEALASGKKWFPYNKGGEFRKWYGNQDYVVNWENDGKEIKDFMPRSVIRNPGYYFKPSVSCGAITSNINAFRYIPNGFIPDVNTRTIYFSDKVDQDIIGLLQSNVISHLIKILNPTMAFNAEQYHALPFIKNPNISLIKFFIGISKSDWDAYETSWDFTDNPLIRTQQPTLEQAFTSWQTQNSQAVAEMKRLEEENNRLFIEAYGLQDELTPDVPDEQITLTRADSEKDSQRLISYAIGCMMGRYSLDEQGLIYANAGNFGFDASRYTRFAADADGIVPITDMLWFEDDATNRLKDFLIAVWGEQTLEQNLTWLATQLGTKAGESAEDIIRRYLSDKFYKDHQQTYKKRPIYWHFSSGKQGAFQALVYLHRYNESTLARMRAEYVVPLMGKLQNRIEMTEKDASVASSTATRNKLTKQVESLRKKHLELLAFDEKLRHYADMRITLDLDDGVKVNYGKFGDLLSDVKAITGGKDE